MDNQRILELSRKIIEAVRKEKELQVQRNNLRNKLRECECNYNTAWDELSSLQTQLLRTLEEDV